MRVPSLFSSVNGAVRALQHAQHALAVHGGNIANSSDPTYTRRTVMPPNEAAVGSPGILRMRDAFLDDQFRLANGLLGETSVRSNLLGKVEAIFGDPVEGGLRQSVDQFFDSWQGLAEASSDGVARLQVISAGNQFVQQVQLTYYKLEKLETTINEELGVRVNEVNNHLDRVFELNKRVSELNRNGQSDADLRDQRDRSLDELAKLTGAKSYPNADGTVRLVLGSTVLLDGPTVNRLSLVKTGETLQPTWVGYPQATFGGSGSIAGLVSTRDNEIKSLMRDVDTLGKTVARAVNEQHMLGKGLDGQSGRPFFAIDENVPAGIEVSRDLKPEHLAAGGEEGQGHPSDGRNARLLTQLGEKGLLNSVIIPEQAQSPRAFYRNLIGWLGSVTQNAIVNEEMSKTHVRVSEVQRQADFGVSMDEEVAHLTMQQKAFAAAARVISVMDEVLDTLINRTGR